MWALFFLFYSLDILLPFLKSTSLRLLTALSSSLLAFDPILPLSLVNGVWCTKAHLRYRGKGTWQKKAKNQFCTATYFDDCMLCSGNEQKRWIKWKLPLRNIFLTKSGLPLSSGHIPLRQFLRGAAVFARVADSHVCITGCNERLGKRFFCGALCLRVYLPRVGYLPPFPWLSSPFVGSHFVSYAFRQARCLTGMTCIFFFF